MKRLLTFFMALALGLSFALFSCTNMKKETGKEEKCETLNTDSLVGLWIKAWNAKDTAALSGMIGEKALLINDGMKLNGRDSIMAKWIKVGLPVVNNMNCDIAGTSSCCCCLSASGFYKIDVGEKDKVVKATGSFTFIWKKQEDKSWKMELIHIATLPEQVCK